MIVHATSLGGVETLIERRARYADEAAPEALLPRQRRGSRTWRICGRDLEAALGPG